MAIRSFTAIAVTSVGNSEVADIFDTEDIRISYAVVVTGTVNYTVQHSLDGLNFFDNSDNTAQTTSQDGNYIFPVRAVRVKYNSGSGSFVFNLRQSIT